MAILAVAADMRRDASHPGRSAPPLPDGDWGLYRGLKAYLECRTRKIDPPAQLVDTWDCFYALYTPRIRAFLSRSGLQAADREDCLQDVWMAVVTRLGHLRFEPRRGCLSAWLMTVARSRTVDWIRRRRHIWVGLDEDNVPVAARGPEPSAECERRSTQALVRSVLAELSGQVSASSFSVFYQRGIEGRTNAEIADTLGLTPEQVRFRYHRMKRKFRDLFEGSADPGRLEGGGQWLGKNGAKPKFAQRDRASSVQRLAGRHASDRA
jgi:RNA polymerase sigma factor (sigma-70 family)